MPMYNFSNEKKKTRIHTQTQPNTILHSTTKKKIEFKSTDMVLALNVCLPIFRVLVSLDRVCFCLFEISNERQHIHFIPLTLFFNSIPFVNVFFSLCIYHSERSNHESKEKNNSKKSNGEKERQRDREVKKNRI